MKNRSRTYNATFRITRSKERSPWRRYFLLVPFLFAWFAFSTILRAVDPPPDGGYPNQNTAEGDDALLSLTTGTSNTAIGFDALFSNTIGWNNTANGSYALFTNVGTDNSATGAYALYSNTTAWNNTAIGFQALYSNTTGYYNTATGSLALYSNTTGYYNTANGYSALRHNTTGRNNIAVGASAGFNLTTGSNNIDIGNLGVRDERDTIRIGTDGTHTSTFVAGISGTTVAGGVGVIVGSDGQLGTVVSSERFKDAIKPMDKSSEAVLALKPVTFRYKHELDPEGILQFGLVAEDVEKVNPYLVARDEQGKPYTVRYEAVNAMLLNEFLKEHKRVEEQQGTIAELKSTLAQQQESFEAKLTQLKNQIEALTAGLQKVSTQLEIMKQTPKTVSNDR